MAGKIKVTKGIFEAIKMLTKGGASIDECTEYMGVSHATVSRIRAAENYEDFMQSRRLAAIAVKRERELKEQQEQQKKEREKPAEKPVEQLVQISQPVQPQVIEHRQTVTVQATHFMMEEMRQQNELLKAISNKLAYIVEQLT